jgi:hypothetical protein
MGLRVVAFAAAFNLLLWTTRLTLGCSIERRLGVGAALAVALLAPAALLLLARRLSPPRASAFAAVSAASLLVAGFGTAAL